MKASSRCEVMISSRKKKPVIFFLGLAGSGKDTQAEILANKYKFKIINSGSILRLFIASFTKFKKDSYERYEAEELKKIMNSGGLVPTLTVISRWLKPLLEIIKHQSRHRGIIFSGSPRKISEAWLLHEFFMNWPDARNNFEIIPIEVAISKKEVLKRVLSRRQCEKCKNIFSAEDLKTMKSCNFCGGRLIRRKDDTKTSVLARIREYKNYTLPVLEYFKKLRKLKRVNGEQSIKKVHEDIVKAVGL